MTFFIMPGLRVLEQTFEETKDGKQFFNVGLIEDVLEGENRQPIQVNIEGRTSNIFNLDKKYTVDFLEVGDDTSSLENSAQYKIISVSVSDLVNVKLKRNSDFDGIYEEVELSYLPVRPELLKLKAGSEVIFGTRETRN